MKKSLPGQQDGSSTLNDELEQVTLLWLLYKSLLKLAFDAKRRAERGKLFEGSITLRKQLLLCKAKDLVSFLGEQQ